jgi:hypothetical protein
MIAESVKKVLKEAYPKIPQWNWWTSSLSFPFKKLY